MSGPEPLSARRWRCFAQILCALLAGLVLSPSIVGAQAALPPASTPEAPIPSEGEAPSGGVIQAGCRSCGSAPPYAHAGAHGDYGPDACGHCLPGRTKPCYACEAKTPIGRFFCGLYECMCCPDPCYEPKWIPVANAAFFVDSARPVTHQRFRWDSGQGLIFPDRAEFFWARADGKGLGPQPKAPFLGETRVRYHELSHYTETATERFGFFVQTPYRSLNAEQGSHAAGFSDMSMGTKSVIFDCELLQVAFQFKTTIPMGNPFKGQGVGHVSLEPSLLIALNLGPDTYLQAQAAEWIPIAGNPDYAGALLHYHVSLNRVICKPLPDVHLIATAELNGWSFQDGEYTDPFLGPQPASGQTYLSVGPGLRLVICDKIDFGVAASFAVTEDHWAETLIRSEFQWRF